jgi:biotin carboxylase
MSRPCIVIVDPYSSGALLGEALAARGAACVAVESTPTLPSSMKSHFDPAVFQETSRHTGDLDATSQAVRRFEPSHVVAGFESGVELAEALAAKLGVPGNVPELGAARRDKFLMAEAVRHSGLRAARQFQASDVDRLIEWARSELTWPVIAKPPKSVASDQVHCCHSVDRLRQAARSILTELNILGMRNATVLVQEFLRGTEFAIDTVSDEGQARLTAIWQYDRPICNDEFVCYDSMRLLPYEGELQAALCEYAFHVLAALGIRFGAAHCEVMMTAEGPVLVEAAARLSAGVNAVLSRVCGGICQLDELVDLLLDPDAFRARGALRPQLNRFAVNVFLMPPYPGILAGTQNVDRLRQLPTLYSLSLASRAGERLGRVAGRVTLVHESPEALRRDRATIYELEQDGIFQMQPAADAP